jgi:hypothetical protein
VQDSLQLYDYWADRTVLFQRTTLGSLQKLTSAANVNMQSAGNARKVVSDKTLFGSTNRVHYRATAQFIQHSTDLTVATQR